jgi:hypothetical protein
MLLDFSRKTEAENKVWTSASSSEYGSVASLAEQTNIKLLHKNN